MQRWVRVHIGAFLMAVPMKNTKFHVYVLRPARPLLRARVQACARIVQFRTDPNLQTCAYRFVRTDPYVQTSPYKLFVQTRRHRGYCGRTCFFSLPAEEFQVRVFFTNLRKSLVSNTLKQKTAMRCVFMRPIATMPLTSDTGVFFCPLPGNLKSVIFSRTSGNSWQTLRIA